ncbi:hypothetical protein STW0522ENT60_30510 [Enterobacter kobei]|nr:hypothetical protein STW0522ENT60_30510 [Enterobacter kobei]
MPTRVKQDRSPLGELNFLKKVLYQRYSLGIHYGFWIMMSFHHQIQ